MHVLRERANALVASHLSTRRIAVHFLPAVARDPHTRVARVALTHDEPAADEERARDRLVCYFRDGNGAQVVRHARALCGDIVTSSGQQPGYDRDSFRRLVRSSAAVIGSAGSNLIAECVLLGVPLLALHHEHDAEQALNARLLASAGAGEAASFERVDAARVRSFWERAQAGHFARLRLAEELPSVADAALASVRELLQTDSAA
jgi:hypothetical protein